MEQCGCHSNLSLALRHSEQWGNSLKRGLKGLNTHLGYCPSQKMQTFDTEMQGNSYVLLKIVGKRERVDKILKLSKMTNISAVFSPLHIPLESLTETE